MPAAYSVSALSPFTAFLPQAFQNNAFQIYGYSANLAKVSIIEVEIPPISARISIIEVS